jgi:nickel-dependent lactate racemase
MVELWLPYGDTEVPVRVPDGNLLGLIPPGEYETIDDVQRKVLEAIREPNQGKSLDQLLDGREKIALILEDPRGLLPIKDLLTPVLSELESSGIERENISLLVAWTDKGSFDIAEINREIRERIHEDIQIFSHDPAKSTVLPLESTSEGTSLEINETFVNSDIRVVLSEVRFDNLAGYTGLGTTIVPGLASSRTIHETWSLALREGCERGIIEENPMSQDMMEAAKIAGVDFLVATVLGQGNEIAGVFGGEPESSFRRAVQLVDEVWKRPVDGLADIVLVSAGGLPFDSYFYWAMDSIDSATPVLQDKGTIVLVAECRGGPGSEELERYSREYKEVRDIRRAFKREATPAGFKSLNLKEVKSRHRIVLVSAMPDFYARRIFGLGTAKTVNNGLVSALRSQGGRSKILLLPQGTSTTPYCPIE